MESNSTLQLKKMSPGEAVNSYVTSDSTYEPLKLTSDTSNSSPLSSSTSLPPNSSHAATFTSLPPELLQEIIETDFDHDSIGKRRADLAGLCLVSKNLRLIAQPLLFRNYHLEIRIDNETTTPEQLKSFHRGGFLADSIQTLKISFVPLRGYVAPDTYLSGFPEFLSTLGHLQTVRTSSDTNRSRDFTTLLPEIASGQPSLKNLELPNVDLDCLSLVLIASSFPHLETLVANLPSLNLTFYLILRPTFHLRRLVVTKLSDSTVLSRLLSSSLSSLRCLSTSIDETMEAVVSIPELVNLRSLNIVLSKPDRASATGSDTPTKRHLDAIFNSALGLPIKDVAISAKFSSASSFTSFVLTSLPEPMESFAFGPTTPENFDWLSLFPRQQPRPYPSLKKLSISPFIPRKVVNFFDRDRRSHTERHFGVKDFYGEYEVELEWITNREHARFDAWILDAPQVFNGYFDDDLKDREKDVEAERALFEESMFEKYGW